MNRVSGFVRIMRPPNCAMMGFAVFVGAVLANPSFTDSFWVRILFGVLTGFSLTGAAMAVNDFFDRDIDRINEPSRPIPAGVVGVRAALVFAAVLTAIGLIFAYLTSPLCLGVAIIAWVIMVAYTTVGKRSGLPGNFLVSACVATPFIYGSLAILDSIQMNVLLFAAMAFLSNTGREITKGIVDIKGDSAQNVRTLAVRFGEKKAAVAAVGFFFLAVCLSPLPLLLGIVSLWFVPFVLFTDIGLVVSSILLLRNYSRENARKTKKLILIWFIAGLLAFIFGRFG